MSDTSQEDRQQHRPLELTVTSGCSTAGGSQRGHNNDTVTRKSPSLWNAKGSYPNYFYFNMALPPQPKLSMWPRGTRRTGLGLSWSLPHPPLQPMHGHRLVEGYILLGPARPLQSGGSGPAGRWPRRSAGPAAGAVVTPWWEVVCSSCSLWGNKGAQQQLSRPPAPRPPPLPWSPTPNSQRRGKEALHSETRVNVSQWRVWHFVEFISN